MRVHAYSIQSSVPLTFWFPQDEYLEAAPGSEGCQEPADAGIQITSQAADAVAGPAAAQPALPVPQVQGQAGAQASPSAAKGPSIARVRPRAATCPRAAKAAEQVNSKAGSQQQQQQVASDNSQMRYLRMMQESGVTPEEMEEGY